jgi:flagellar basal-body rod protein FlgB
MTMLDTALGLSATALSLRAKRMDVIAGNIANAATPGFKARDLDADAALQNLAQGGFGSELAGAHLKYRAALQPSLDGNTVEMATEQAAFAENALKYQASLGFLTSRIQTIMSALKGEA